MPKLHWIGKDKVVHHHRDVPYRALDLKYRFAAPEGTPANSSGNHIIHGDNLDALKSLIPEFEGKINCIYIDPPYNTGNEGWVYNDAVNDPKMQKWLGKVVGKEGEDLTRHDKWLCMMYPRLKLLHRLLAKDGVIFVSIDDNEQAHLKLVMDEIFGARLFVANFIWKKKGTTSNVDGAEVSSLFDNTLCYKKTTTAKITARTYSSSEREYPYADELGAYRMTVIEKKSDGEYERKTMMFKIIGHNPRNGKRWQIGEEKARNLEAKERFFYDGEKVLLKIYSFEDKDTTSAQPNILDTHGSSEKAGREIKNIFGGLAIFDTPKPRELIEHLLTISTDKNSIILDSFAGSGTTAHAALKLNAQDGGNRRFILVETMDYAETITAERVRRVMSGYGEGTKAVAGLGGAFDFYSVGEKLFDEFGHLNPKAEITEIRKYIAWQEGLSIAGLTTPDSSVSPYWLGINNTVPLYFCYAADQVMTLDFELLAELKVAKGRSVIYADLCTLGEKFMAQSQITFKKIPRDIAKL